VNARFCLEFEQGVGWHLFVSDGERIIFTSVRAFPDFDSVSRVIDELLSMILSF
jgi:hypothetical protein